MPSRPIKSHTTTRARAHRTETDPNKRAHPHPHPRVRPCLLIKARRCLSLLSDGFRRSRSGTGSRQITTFGRRSPRTDSDRLPSSCPAQAAIQPLNSFTVSGAKTRPPRPNPATSPLSMWRSHVLFCDGENQNISSRAYFLLQWKTSK